MARDPLRFLERAAQHYGDIIPFRILNRPAFLIKHPDHVREILVNRQHSFTKSPALQRAKRFFGEGLLTSEGEFHTRQRRLLQPAFHRDRLQSYGATMTSYALQARERFVADSEVNIRDEMMRLTLAIVARTLFDADVEGDAKNVGEAMADILRSFNIVQMPFWKLLRKMPLPQHRREENALRTIREIVDRIIREHRTAHQDSGDLLSTLLAIRDEDGSSLNDEQIHDEILTLFVAGHETTALALTWTWYLLAKNQACEGRLHQEIDSVLAGRAPQFDDIPRLTYVEKVISEAMRLYPPAWLFGRMAKERLDLGGVTIPVGGICLLSPYIAHRDPRFFPAPERFDPERWRPEVRDARPKFSYFPFGGGTRVCIGERFAMAELILLVATLAQKWRFRLVSSEAPTLKPRITLGPGEPIRMTFLPR